MGGGRGGPDGGEHAGADTAPLQRLFWAGAGPCAALDNCGGPGPHRFPGKFPHRSLAVLLVAVYHVPPVMSLPAFASGENDTCSEILLNCS